MISVAEARKLIDANVHALEPVSVPLKLSAGLTLAEDIYAPIDIPAFPQSAMDGYAFSFADWQRNNRLKILGEIAAGHSDPVILQPGAAFRIFTGAAIPSGADTVVMQEKVMTENGDLIIDDEKLQPGTNVRLKGADIKAGSLALDKETTLSPAAIGFLAGLGIADVIAYSNPSITIIITGNELQQPGASLQYGQVYESSSFSLVAALQQLHINNTRICYAVDKPDIIIANLEIALQQSDVVLLTGGISVGDYDFVLQATTECSVEKIFHKVKQRPGKPLFFGKKGKKIVFGLPGNPSSVLSCFYQYVVPVIEILSKRKKILQHIQAPLGKQVKKAAGLTHFLKGFYDGKTVTALEAQESYRLSSFARANCLIEVPEDTTVCNEEDMLDALLLPS